MFLVVLIILMSVESAVIIFSFILDVDILCALLVSNVIIYFTFNQVTKTIQYYYFRFK